MLKSLVGWTPGKWAHSLRSRQQRDGGKESYWYTGILVHHSSLQPSLCKKTTQKHHDRERTNYTYECSTCSIQKNLDIVDLLICPLGVVFTWMLYQILTDSIRCSYLPLLLSFRGILFVNKTNILLSHACCFVQEKC